MNFSRKSWTFAVALVGSLLVGASTARPAAADPDVKADNSAYATPTSRIKIHIDSHLHKDGTVDGKMTINSEGPNPIGFPGKIEVDLNDMVIGLPTPLGTRATVSGIVKKVDSDVPILQALVGKTLIVTVLDSDDGTDNKKENDLPDQISTIQIDTTNTKNAHTFGPSQVLSFRIADGDIRVNQE